MVIFKGRALILAKQKDFSGGEWLVQLETAPVKCSINDKILKEPSGVSNLAFLSYTIAAEVSFPLREKGNSFPLLCFSFFFIFFFITNFNHGVSFDLGESETNLSLQFSFCAWE